MQNNISLTSVQPEHKLKGFQERNLPWKPSIFRFLALLLQLSQDLSQQLRHEVVKLSDQLYRTLTPPQQELLEQLIHAIYSANLIESESYFSFGFSLGLELQREIQDQLQCLAE